METAGVSLTCAYSETFLVIALIKEDKMIAALKIDRIIVADVSILSGFKLQPWQEQALMNLLCPPK